MKKSLFVLLLPLGGILTALCLVFPQIGFLEWLTMVPALLYLFGRAERTETRYRRWYLFGFLYYFSFFLTVLHWFLELYPMEFAGVSKGEAALLVAICWVGLSLLQTLIAACSFPLFIFLCRHTLLRRVPLLMPFLFAAVYSAFEWGQTLFWYGVPWARLPLGQASCGFLWNSASLFGSYLLTFSLVAVNSLIAYAVLHLDRVRVAAISAAAVFLFNAVAGCIGFYTADTDSGEAIVVAAVQGNVGSSEKWTSDSAKKSYEVYERYTKEAAERGAQLVVFPETFVPYHVTAHSSLGEYVTGLASTYGVTIMCGAFDTTEDGETANAVFTVFPDGTLSETVYHKRHLVPFGEYVPMRAVIEVLIPPLADIGMLSDDLAKGTDSAIFNTPLGQIGTLICFDSIYESLTLTTVRDGAELIVLPTNDSWFLDSAAAYMHHAQARLRAIEVGRYIVRSADTGISSVIAPDGTSDADIPPLVEGVSISTVHLSDARTLYSYIGNLFVYLLLAALTLLFFHRVWLKYQEKKEKSDEPA